MDRPWISQLRKGLLELAILAALREQEAYGYQLLQRLAALNTNGALATTESTLYPILSRLAEEELLTVRQVPSPAGPPRRYYRLTAAGRQRLGEMAHDWQELYAALDSLLHHSPLNRGDRV